MILAVDAGAPQQSFKHFLFVLELVRGLVRLWLGGDRSRSKIPGSRDFKRPEHSPQSPAGVISCTVVYYASPYVSCRRESEKKSTAGR